MLSPFNLCLNFANVVEFLESRESLFQGVRFCDPRKLYVVVFSTVDGMRDVKYVGVRSLFIL